LQVGLDVQGVKTELKLAKAQKYMNAVIPMIAILGYSEVNIKVSDAGIENVKSDDCKEVSGNDRDINGMLAVLQEEARFSYKDRQKFIDIFT